MIRSPLHLLISLQRFLYRTKIRHKSAFLFSRPISKSTSWSVSIALRIPRTSTPISTKSIPTSVLQEPSDQLLRMTQRQSPTTRRLLMSRQSLRQGHAAIYVQSRTMLSSGNAANNQVTTVLNPAQFFTPRPPILGVHGGIVPPPTPQASLRSYVNHPPWANQQHQQTGSPSPVIPSSSEVDMDDIDNTHDDEYYNSMRYNHCTNQRSLTNTAISIAATQTTHSRQQSYRPPNLRGIADLMENDNGNDKDNIQADTDGTGSNRYSPGLVHRGQPPRKWSPRQNQLVATTSTRRMSTMNVLRHDDLSLQTTKKRRSSTHTSSATDTTTSTSTAPDVDDGSHFLDLTQQWYISIPMDLAFLMQSGNSSFTPSSSSATTNLFSMDNAVSILDPVWMKSFDQWGKLIRSHLTKVMVLIRLVGLEAQRYYTKGRQQQKNATNDDDNGDITEKYMEHDGHPNDSDISTDKTTEASESSKVTSTTLDFKMMMKMNKSNTPSELRIYLPHHLCTPSPTTIQTIQQWVHRLMKDPPCFEIKYGTKDDTTNYNNDLETAMTNDDGLLEIPTSGMNIDERGMEMDGLSESNDGGDDDDPWRIGPLYFQGIHSFLNHVDTMIDSSPAFATGGQRRFSL